MPRTARRKSESNIYHIMIRGINQVQLFYDDADKEAFLKRLERYKEECDLTIFAWCLMDNHMHLLVRSDLDNLSSAMKRLQLSYSGYYNRKYDRNGYLFQDRFKSKPVDDEGYFLSVLRYIHRNPLEAGKWVDEWTSYDEYMSTPRITDTGFAFSILSENKSSARAAFRKLVEDDREEESSCGFTRAKRLNDADAREKICSAARIDHCQQLCDMNRENQIAVIKELRKQGLSIRQIARLTGLNRNTVERAKP